MKKLRKVGTSIQVKLFTVLVVSVLFISVGFSALSTLLSINGTTSFKPVGMILVMNVVPNQSTMQNSISATHTHDTINVSGELPTLNDELTYDVTIKNLGQTNKILTEVITDLLSNNDVRYDISGLSIGDIFLPGQSVTFQVTFKYKTGVSSITDDRINSSIRFVFDDYEIPPVAYGYFIPYDGQNTLLGLNKSNITGFKRNTTLNLYQVQHLSGVQTVHNVSEDQYNSLTEIYAWIDENGVFNWWSNADVVYFHPDTVNAFRNFGSITSVDLTGTSTEKVENFAHWFDKDRVLTTITGKINTSGLKLQYNNNFDYAHDVSNDSSSGYGTTYMFNDCNELVTVDLSEIDTTNSSDLKRMFAGCKKLKEIDVSRFNTTNAKSLYWLFRACNALTEVNMASFDTSNVVNFHGLFTSNYGITKVYLGENWDVSNGIEMQNMFYDLTNMKTIYAVHDFVFNQNAVTTNMFHRNTKLVGARDTAYAFNFNSSYTDGTYAKIATSEQNGYFTLVDPNMQYSITYTLNGGTANNPTSYTHSTPTFSLVAPNKPGYTFLGWTGSNGNSNQTSVTITQGTVGNKHYEAHYDVNTYLVQFASNGGSGSMSFQEFVYDQAKNLNANEFTYANHSFVGWNTKADGSGISLTDQQSVINLTTSGTITLYAQWLDLTDPFPSVFSLSGPCYVNGNNNVTGETCVNHFNSKTINTHISLFSAENKNKDFEISFTFSGYSASNQTESQATLMNFKYESSASQYPGCVFRRISNDLQFSCRFGSTSQSVTIGVNEVQTFKVVRKDGKIYYAVNSEPYIELIDTAGYTGTYDTPVTFGSSLNTSGTPMRVVKQTYFSDMSIKLGTIGTIQTQAKKSTKK